MFSLGVYLQVAASLAVTFVSYFIWTYLTSPSKLQFAMLFRQYTTYSLRVTWLSLVVVSAFRGSPRALRLKKNH